MHSVHRVECTSNEEQEEKSAYRIYQQVKGKNAAQIHAQNGAVESALMFVFFLQMLRVERNG